MAKIVRPVHGRVQVWLPFQPGSGNYDLLREICGDLTRPEYDRTLRCFEVARSHLPALMEHLPEALGRPVEVILHGSSQTKCVEACWNASPDSAWECVCSCAGRFHGTRAAPPKDLGGGLAVATEYTTHAFTLYPWTIRRGPDILARRQVERPTNGSAMVTRTASPCADPRHSVAAVGPRTVGVKRRARLHRVLRVAAW